MKYFDIVGNSGVVSLRMGVRKSNIVIGSFVRFRVVIQMWDDKETTGKEFEKCAIWYMYTNCFNV